jgi:ParB-like chromosome segregation protein Spo0J
VGSEQNWPAYKIVRRKIADLVPYAKNARLHSVEQINQIAASIQEWGFTNPILLDESDGIIAGHGRVLALQKLGIAEAPCMVARGWSDALRGVFLEDAECRRKLTELLRANGF